MLTPSSSSSGGGGSGEGERGMILGAKQEMITGLACEAVAEDRKRRYSSLAISNTDISKQPVLS